MKKNSYSEKEIHNIYGPKFTTFGALGLYMSNIIRNICNTRCGIVLGIASLNTSRKVDYRKTKNKMGEVPKT